MLFLWKKKTIQYCLREYLQLFLKIKKWVCLESVFKKSVKTSSYEKCGLDLYQFQYNLLLEESVQISSQSGSNKCPLYFVKPSQVTMFPAMIIILHEIQSISLGVIWVCTTPHVDMKGSLYKPIVLFINIASLLFKNDMKTKSCYC